MTTARPSGSRSVVGMDVAGVGVAAAFGGALIGVVTLQSLQTVRYRYAHEASAPLPAPPRWVIPAAAIAAALLAVRFGSDRPLVLLVVAPLVAAGPWLAAVDLDVHRLPNRVLGPLGAASVTTVVVAAVATDSLRPLLLGLIGAAVAGGGYLLMHLVGKGALGLGDVKLAAVMGIAVGALGLGVLWWALFLSSILCLAWVLAVRRGRPSGSRIPFGPWMLVGSLVAVLIFG